MSQTIKISRGANIKLKGAAEKVLVTLETPPAITIKPTDFHGLQPRLEVKEGDVIKAGTPLFHNKMNESIKFTSPIGGTVTEIVRGEKRRILEIRLKTDKNSGSVDYGKADPNKLSREQVMEKLLASGVWPLVIQRPFSNVANPSEKPKAIFISGFNSSPLGTDVDFILHGMGDLFQIGIDAIAKLTDGKVHLNLSADAKHTGVLTNCKKVQLNYFSGPHPAGNVGIQIHHLDPINKGEKVWCIDAQAVLTIGALFRDGIFDATRIVAVTGPQVKKPKYVKTIIGAPIRFITDGNLEEGQTRLISGNILTGDKVTAEGNLGFYHDQVTALKEHHESEFLGWLNPGTEKASLSRTFLNWLTPAKEFSLSTALHGEKRAFVMSGEYERVLPMDIYPVYLLKAILAQDIERMENLGIYEVAPEDFALCEFGCTSKISVQEIVRSGLDLIEKECS